MGGIASAEHRVAGDEGKVYLWEKHPAAGPGRNVVLLVHGATYSGRTVFDVQVPGRAEWSCMDYLAGRGFDVWAIDIRSYGQSDRARDDFAVTAEPASRDVAAAVEYICGQRGLTALDLLGFSWGTRITSIYTATHPERVQRLTLIGGAPTAPWRQRPAPSAERRQTNTRDAFLTRTADEQRLMDPAALDAFMAGVFKYDPTSPTGVQRDPNFSEGVPPSALRCPLLFLDGAHDQALQNPNLIPFFGEIPVEDKRFVVVPGNGHWWALENPSLVCREIALFFGAAVGMAEAME